MTKRSLSDIPVEILSGLDLSFRPAEEAERAERGYSIARTSRLYAEVHKMCHLKATFGRTIRILKRAGHLTGMAVHGAREPESREEKAERKRRERLARGACWL